MSGKLPKSKQETMPNVIVKILIRVILWKMVHWFTKVSHFKKEKVAKSSYFEKISLSHSRGWKGI